MTLEHSRDTGDAHSVHSLAALTLTVLAWVKRGLEEINKLPLDKTEPALKTLELGVLGLPSLGRDLAHKASVSVQPLHCPSFSRPCPHCKPPQNISDKPLLPLGSSAEFQATVLC